MADREVLVILGSMTGIQDIGSHHLSVDLQRKRKRKRQMRGCGVKRKGEFEMIK